MQASHIRILRATGQTKRARRWNAGPRAVPYSWREGDQAGRYTALDSQELVFFRPVKTNIQVPQKFFYVGGQRRGRGIVVALLTVVVFFQLTQ